MTEGRPWVHLSAVHPRVRGEHSIGAFLDFLDYGSSPRSRGTSRGVPRLRPHLRFIPAFAGNIGLHSATRPQMAVHPRVRGEHLHFNDFNRRIAGSSPRSRGTSFFDFLMSSPLRFIPAFAGNIPRRRIHIRNNSVHPRVRGEHAGTAARLLNEDRFIPAFAGNISQPK